MSIVNCQIVVAQKQSIHLQLTLLVSSYIKSVHKYINYYSVTCAVEAGMESQAATELYNQTGFMSQLSLQCEKDSA